MRFELLADHPPALATVARWLHGEWGHQVTESSEAGLRERLAARMSRNKLPLHLLAIDDSNEIVGFAALKLREMDLYPHREHWLGSVYVPPKQRGRGIASSLVEALMARAIAHGVSLVSLQTENHNGGLYAKLGWQPVERVHYHGVEVLVMERRL